MKDNRKPKQQHNNKQADAHDASLDHHSSFLMRLNEHIKSGYRINHSFAQLARSLFGVHNETVNIWTHLIGAVVIYTLIFSTSLYVDNRLSHEDVTSIPLKIQNSLYKWSSSNQTLVVDPNLQDNINQFALKVVEANVAINEISSQISQFLKKTKQDKIAIRLKVINYQKTIKNTKDQLERTLMMLHGEGVKLEANLLGNMKQRLNNIRQSTGRTIRECLQAINKYFTFINPISRWPIIVFLVSASLCLTFSSIFHLLYPLSQRAYILLRRLDYSGVVLLIIGSSFPVLDYGFACSSTLVNIYLPCTLIFGLVVFCLLMGEWINRIQNRKKKSKLYMFFGLFFLIPMFHAYIIEHYYNNFGDSLKFSQFLGQYLLLGSAYLLGLLIYTIRCPQRFAPGKFDICGASHQIWHFLVLLGIGITYSASLGIYQKRRLCPCV